MKLLRRLPLCLFLVIPSSWAATTDPSNTGFHFSYGENVGWVNTKPTAIAEPGMQVAQTGVAGWLWLENAGWLNLSCRNTGSCTNNPFEVTHQGDGMLAGYAWSENAGWINFSCSNNNSCAAVQYGVHVNLSSGQLSGFAWSENMGWISFSCQDTNSCDNNAFGVTTLLPLPLTANPAVPTIFFSGFE